MPLLSPPVNIDQLVPGTPRTTHAGRFAIPVDLRDGAHTLARLGLVFDGPAAEQLYAALGAHLAGHGASTPAPTMRSRAELL